jgi:hypothetical protein
MGEYFHQDRTAVVPTPGGREPSGAEHRQAQRFSVLLRTAKLVVDDQEYLCVLRDASETGVKLRLFHDLPHGENVSLDLGNGVHYPMELVWQSQGHAGFRFRDTVDVRKLIDESGGQRPRRPMRLNIGVEATLHAHGGTLTAQLINISQQGVCLECDDPLLMRERIKIESDLLPALFGRICWRQRPRYGVVFDQGFHLDELARQMARLHEGQSQATIAGRQAI